MSFEYKLKVGFVVSPKGNVVGNSTPVLYQARVRSQSKFAKSFGSKQSARDRYT